MKKTMIRITTLILMAAGASMATAHGFAHHHGHPLGMNSGKCFTQDAGTYRLDYMKAFYESVGKTLTLTDKQANVWQKYVDTRLQAVKERAQWREAHKVPCMDEQTRLERRADRARLNARLGEKIAQQRGELLKVLDPKQKMVLETYEFRKHGQRARMHEGPKHRPHCQTPPCVDRKGPGMTPN